MRHIKKKLGTQGPQCLEQKHNKIGKKIKKTKVSRAQWNDKFDNKCKKILRGFLSIEQYHLCAYTEIDLDYLGCHIEHIKPVSCYPSLVFDYHNLVLSCIREKDVNSLKDYPYEKSFGGHYKGGNFSNKELDKYDPDLFVSPLDSDCADYFSYQHNGKVNAKPSLSGPDKAKAEYTITALHLNAPELVRQRGNILKEMTKQIDDLQDNPEALRAFIKTQLWVEGGMLPPFYSARLQHLGQLGREISLQQSSR